MVALLLAMLAALTSMQTTHENFAAVARCMPLARHVPRDTRTTK
jgi:hypothetical protein